MASFEIDKQILKKLIEVCSMEGIIQFREKSKIRQALYGSFYLDVNPEGFIKMLSMDTYRKKTPCKVTLKGVRIIKEGIIPVMDQKAVTECLTGRGLEGKIIVESNKSILLLSTDKDFYEIRQKQNLPFEDLKEEEKAQIIKKLDDFDNLWRFDGDNGGLVYYHPSQDVPYDMRIKLKKSDLTKIVGDTTKLVQDSKTTLSFKDGVFKANKGAENAKIKSGHEVSFEDKGKELIEFDEKFYNLQTIFPNLFEDIEFNIRRVKANDTIDIVIRSIDKKLNMEIVMNILSIIKGEKSP